ncbi:hypothetical protein ACWERV_35875 [Streptomyces sp. NPDC004031]|jgi:hypothetical protein
MLIAWGILVVAAIAANMTYWVRRAGPVRTRFRAEHPEEWERMGSRARSYPGPEGNRILVWHTVTFLLLVVVGCAVAALIAG